MMTEPNWKSPGQWMKFILAMAGGLLGLPFAAVVTLAPVRYVALDSSCQVKGVVPSLQATIQGKRFWRQQLESLDEELARPTIEDVMARAEQQLDQFYEEFYRKNPDRRPSPSNLEAERLREEADILLKRADAIEHPELEVLRRQISQRITLERQRRHEVLRNCRPTIEARSGLDNRAGR